MREYVMSDFLGKAIEENNRKAKKLFLAALAVLCAGVPVGVFLSPVCLVAMIIASSITAAYGITIRARNITFRAGYDGEKRFRKVVREIATGDEYAAYYNVPVAHGDLDCFLVGPTGIFCFEVKNHNGRIVYNEQGWTQIKTGRNGTVYQGGPAESVSAAREKHP